MGFARGKYAKFICDRCGFEYPYKTRRKEEGTKAVVCRDCYDGRYDSVLHPQNHPPGKLSDNVALRDARTDVDFEDVFTSDLGPVESVRRVVPLASNQTIYFTTSGNTVLTVIGIKYKLASGSATLTFAEQDFTLTATEQRSSLDYDFGPVTRVEGVLSGVDAGTRYVEIEISYVENDAEAATYRAISDGLIRVTTDGTIRNIQGV